MFKLFFLLFSSLIAEQPEATHFLGLLDADNFTVWAGTENGKNLPELSLRRDLFWVDGNGQLRSESESTAFLKGSSSAIVVSCPTVQLESADVTELLVVVDKHGRAVKFLGKIRWRECRPALEQPKPRTQKVAGLFY